VKATKYKVLIVDTTNNLCCSSKWRQTMPCPHCLH